MKMNAKRILSAVLCLVMLLSVLTVAAYAAPTTPAEIVAAAYALEKGATLEGTYTLEGEITKIDTPYDTGYNNITVTIEIEGCEEQPIMCFRLKGTGADTLAVGDTITVTGTLINYKGTVEFAQGCTLDKIIKGDGEVAVAPEDPLEIVAAAYALAEGESLPYLASLTGKIISVDTPYDATYKNITVTITVEGAEDQPIQCYRMKGAGADTLAVADTITVYGSLKNRYGKVEFNAPSLKAVVEGPNHIDLPEVPEQIAAVEAAYALEENASMDASTTLTGFIVGVDSPFDARFNNVSVVMAVPGTTDMPIVCFRLVGEGVDVLAIGDAITVTGTLKNYKGTIEFDAGCTLDSFIKGGNMPPVAPEDPVKIVEAAYKLSKNTSLPYFATLTGVVTEITSEYSEQYGNITLVMEVPGTTEMPLICYRLKGEGIDSVKVGDVITVTGIIKNYYDKIEFDTGCTMDAKVGSMGDVNGDGRIDICDAARLYAHVKGSNLITDETALLCADVTGGGLSIDDTASIYAHVRGTKSLF